MSEKQEAVQKTAEELKMQQQRDAEERQKYLHSHVPELRIDGLDQSSLQSKVRELYGIVCRLEEEKYDCEFKLRKMDFEINELNIVVNDIKGHFVKPMLNKISKTEQKLAKIAEVKSKLHSAGGFREGLKSTGQQKFAIDEKEEGKKPEWGQDALKQASVEVGEGAEPQEEEEEEEEEE